MLTSMLWLNYSSLFESLHLVICRPSRWALLMMTRIDISACSYAGGFSPWCPAVRIERIPPIWYVHIPNPDSVCEMVRYEEEAGQESSSQHVRRNGCYIQSSWVELVSRSRVWEDPHFPGRWRWSATRTRARLILSQVTDERSCCLDDHHLPLLSQNIKLDGHEIEGPNRILQ